MDKGNDTDREARKGKEGGRKGGNESERPGRDTVSENPRKDGDLSFSGPRASVSSEEKIWKKTVVMV